MCLELSSVLCIGRARLEGRQAVAWSPAVGLISPLLCTVSCSLVFGSRLDIHSGGIDLAFPHHENEIAQCEAFHRCPQWGNYFLHSGEWGLGQTASFPVLPPQSAKPLLLEMQLVPEAVFDSSPLASLDWKTTRAFWNGGRSCESWPVSRIAAPRVFLSVRA